MGGVAFWGVLTNLMMLNVVFGRNAGPTEEDEDEFRKDAATAAALIVFSFVPRELPVNYLEWSLTTPLF